MKIIKKMLVVSFEHDIQVDSNNAIEVTIEHQAFIYKNKDGDIDVDVEFMDVRNAKFMGVPIKDGYKGFTKFKQTMLGLGINVNKMIDEKETELISDKDLEMFKAMYRFNFNW